MIDDGICLPLCGGETMRQTTILVVDDDPAINELVQDCYMSTGRDACTTNQSVFCL